MNLKTKLSELRFRGLIGHSEYRRLKNGLDCAEAIRKIRTDILKSMEMVGDNEDIKTGYEIALKIINYNTEGLDV